MKDSTTWIIDSINNFRPLNVTHYLVEFIILYPVKRGEFQCFDSSFISSLTKIYTLLLSNRSML